MIHPLKDLLKRINFELEKEFMSVRQNKNFPFGYGCEWECISLNLHRLKTVFQINMILIAVVMFLF